MTDNHDPDLTSDAVAEHSGKENQTRRRTDTVHHSNQGPSMPAGEADQSVTVASPTRRRNDHGDGEEIRPSAASQHARPFLWSVIAAVVMAVAPLAPLATLVPMAPLVPLAPMAPRGLASPDFNDSTAA